MRKHWTEAVKAENERLKAEISEMRMQPHIRAFAERVGNSVMLILANKPFDKWPDEAKIAFKHESERTSIPAYFYRERLPK
jgi:predicted xylose isomerase-like sugar epimerase